MFRGQREQRLLERLEALSRTLAVREGQADAAEERLRVFDDLEEVKTALSDKQIELDRVLEKHAKEKRDIEHKLGLHRQQVAQESEAAVREAKLSVREEALEAQKGRFQEEMDFMQKRFESEVQAQRVLVEQVLERLPKFERTYTTVEHVGNRPPDVVGQLEITDGS